MGIRDIYRSSGVFVFNEVFEFSIYSGGRNELMLIMQHDWPMVNCQSRPVNNFQLI